MSGREIKFRVWDKELKRMINISLCDLFDGGCGYGNIEDFEVMQYTGLKDENGKEIYEGDILLYKKRLKGVVKFDYGKFFVDWHGYYRENDNSLNEYIGENIYDPSRLSEVIGNIYENPELL